MLVALNPSATATYDALLGPSAREASVGLRAPRRDVGAAVAKEILAWRQNDGWVVSSLPAYSQPPLPGR